MIFSVIVTAAILIVIAAACIRTVCISGGRYMSAALPMFMIMGGCSEKYDTGAAAYMMISGILYGVFLVGFFMQRSII